jgi:uncharacterized protein (DUF1330 family)
MECAQPVTEVLMAKAYWIASYRSIKDSAALDAYAKLAGPAIGAAGGRVVVRGMPAKTLEAGLDLRTVVIEFDSVASAIAAYDRLTTAPPVSFSAIRSSATSGSWRAPSSSGWRAGLRRDEARGVG